jgi:hypothetical protein
MSFGLLKRLASVRPTGECRLRLEFEDGVAGELDMSRVVPLRGVLASLADPAFVREARIDPVSGTLVWPDGTDLDPVVLYCAVRGIPAPDYGRRPIRAAMRRRSLRKRKPNRRRRESSAE